MSIKTVVTIISKTVKSNPDKPGLKEARKASQFSKR